MFLPPWRPKEARFEIHLSSPSSSHVHRCCWRKKTLLQLHEIRIFHSLQEEGEMMCLRAKSVLIDVIETEFSTCSGTKGRKTFFPFLGGSFDRRAVTSGWFVGSKEEWKKDSGGKQVLSTFKPKARKKISQKVSHNFATKTLFILLKQTR